MDDLSLGRSIEIVLDGFQLDEGLWKADAASIDTIQAFFVVKSEDLSRVMWNSKQLEEQSRKTNKRTLEDCPRSSFPKLYEQVDNN